MTKSMETDSFILALRCFIAIRGNVRTIWCDNGSNFVGAERELAKSMDINLSNEVHAQWAFNKSGATQSVALNIFMAFDRIWHAGLLHKLMSYGISGQKVGLISSFLSNRWLGVVLDGKSSQ